MHCRIFWQILLLVTASNIVFNASVRKVFSGFGINRNEIVIIRIA
ncbi:hypothetical protein ACFL50_01560 [Candidatus Latescibacterota bacterium]